MITRRQKNQTLLDETNNSNSTLLESLSGNFTNSTNATSANKTAPEPTTKNMDSKQKASSAFGSYFSFFKPQQSTPKKEPPKPTAIDKTSLADKKNKTSKYQSNIYFYNTKKKNQETNIDDNNQNKNSTAMALLNKDANDTITVADLQVLLSQMQSTANTADANEKALTKISKSKPKTTTGGSGSASSSSDQVAFPQPTQINEQDIRRSTAITSSFVGMILGITILPNLWLVGMVAGALYGLDVTKDIGEYDPEQKNSLANFLISTATRLAKAYRKTVDGLKALWFLYKTGQLSYEYYKSYETLDKKFAIQQKVDAWNRVFAEGKKKFDAWEKENEVSRKVLAGLRTAWLVDEESRKRAAGGKSRYRLVQSFYDLRRSVQKVLKRTMKSIRSLSEEGGLETFWKGLQADLQSEGSLSIRIGAIAAAVAAVNVFGALFSLSAGFSNLLAILLAVIWPSWASDLVSRTQEIWLDIQSRGSNPDTKSSGNSYMNPIECLQQLYEEHSNSRMNQSRRNQGMLRWRRPKRRQDTKRTATKKPKRRQTQKKNQPWFGFGKTKTRSGGKDVGTWGNYRRTR